ncbi:MAG TPA: iron dependent repressor, metal binding and dimerization domain protein [Thermoplasmata archaeon]|nr:iron dependent repressor, metal binding and dimerization domain protein [Thermoplasmata archaeon]
MEVLERLSRRQVEALAAVRRGESGEKGASLNFVARELGIRPPSALDRLTTLEELHLLARYRGKSRLTPRGEACLAEYQRHHRVAESLFQRLGLSAEDTHAAALEVDLALSHQTVNRLCEAEGHPKECPHGEPIAPCHGPSPSARN